LRHRSQGGHFASQISGLSLVFVCSILFLALTAKASPTTVVTVEPNSSSAMVGETFSVNVTVVDVENLFGVDATLTWNSTILTLVNCEIQLGQEGGALNPPIYIAENSSQGSKYTISATSTNPAPSFNGTGIIVRLNFSVLSIGTCKLDLQTQLYDYPPPDRDPRLSLPIAHEDIDGVFQGVIPEFPHSLFFVITALLTLSMTLLSKRISSRNNKTFGKSVSNRGPPLREEKSVQLGAV
jgi:Cohesin domain